jgi:23S rRNA (guanine745-N1)-methyltransferase
MMRARRNFLEAGFYQSMAEALAKIIDTHKPPSLPMRILDTNIGHGLLTF